MLLFDAPGLLGKENILLLYVYANLFHEALKGHSVNVINHIMYATPIDWFSKKQTTIEAAIYGSEFVAVHTYMEQTIDLHTMLRDLGVPVHEKRYIFGDYESFVNFSFIPHVKLHKCYNTLFFHCVHEAVASMHVKFYFLSGASNQLIS